MKSHAGQVFANIEKHEHVSIKWRTFILRRWVDVPEETNFCHRDISAAKWHLAFKTQIEYRLYLLFRNAVSWFWRSWRHSGLFQQLVEKHTSWK
jgi:hypothetical protein